MQFVLQKMQFCCNYTKEKVSNYCWKTRFKLFLQGTTYWKDDKHFGRQRLQGCNPTVIKLCKEMPKK